MEKKEYGFHSTNVTPEIVLRDGLSKFSKGFTNFEVIDNINDYLPENRIYISRNPKKLFNAKYIYKIDITGLRKYPDFGSLPDFGCFMDELSCYWDEKTIEYVKNPEMKKVIENNDMELEYNNISGDDTWNWIGSCVIEGPILPHRISLFKTYS